MTQVQKITPFLWFDMNAEEAMEYYTGVFPDSKIEHIQRYPDESLDEHFKGMNGKVLSGTFTLAGQQFMCLDGGPVFTFNEAVSFLVSCKDQKEIDYYWSKLSHVPASEQCGWCKDKFGVSWQIIPENMGELLRSPAAIQAMMQMKKIVIAELAQANA
ncbi:MAG TPA: VOC family protein [Candidatus Saccharimonadales bacterium]|nr:VOC family protein [Candidatus Saccharimonadales bacterium]